MSAATGPASPGAASAVDADVRAVIDRDKDKMQEWVRKGEMWASVYEGAKPLAVARDVLRDARPVLGGRIVITAECPEGTLAGDVLGDELVEAGWAEWIHTNPQRHNGLPTIVSSPSAVDTVGDVDADVLVDGIDGGGEDAVVFVDGDVRTHRIYTAVKLMELPDPHRMLAPTSFCKTYIPLRNIIPIVRDPANVVDAAGINAVGMRMPLYQAPITECLGELQTRADIIECIHQCALAVHYLHSHNFVHGSVSSDHVLYRRPLTQGGMRVALCGLGSVMHLDVSADARPARFHFLSYSTVWNECPLEAILEIPTRYEPGTDVVDTRWLQALDIFGLGVVAATILSPDFRGDVTATEHDPRYVQGDVSVRPQMHYDVFGYPPQIAADAMLVKIVRGARAHPPGSAGRAFYGASFHRLDILTRLTRPITRSAAIDWARGGGAEMHPCIRDALSSIPERRPSAAEFAARLLAEEAARPPEGFVHAPRDDDTTPMNTLAPMHKSLEEHIAELK